MLKNAHILLDTCIINNLLSKEAELVSKTQNILQGLLSGKNSLYISHFTKYELLRSTTEEKKAQCEKEIKKLVQIETNDARLNRASHLYSLYKNHVEIKSQLQSISDIDIFIGSLIFTTGNAYLLTADYWGYPRPFFLEKEVWSIEYKRNVGQKSFVYYYLLEANLSEF